MQEGRASKTAAWVAAGRGLGAMLPERARLCDDPYGVRFGGAEGLLRLHRRAPWLATHVVAPALAPGILYMQVRTRVIDDELRAFVASGGRQILLLGAGFDCRAARFAKQLEHAMVFEVDHPATQARKRAVLAGEAAAKTVYLAWNFEERAVGELPRELSVRGHDASRPTLTIWEGVTMYLQEASIDASVRAVRELSAPGSRFAFTYFDRTRLARPTLGMRVRGRAVARWGEPVRFGWDPAELPAWMRARGFEVLRDREARDWARDFLPPRWAARCAGVGSHIAIAAP